MLPDAAAHRAVSRFVYPSAGRIPAFYEITSAGPVPAGGTDRSKVSGDVLLARDMRLGVTSGRFRTLSPITGTTTGFPYACMFGRRGGPCLTRLALVVAANQGGGDRRRRLE